MDPLATRPREFWKNYGEHNDVDASKIQTEVFRLPTTCFAEERGSLVNSSRWLQWHWKGADGPGESRSDWRSCRGSSPHAQGVSGRTAANSRSDRQARRGRTRTRKARRRKNWRWSTTAARHRLTDPKDPTKVLVKKPASNWRALRN
jgi:formate dehydrogenase major subunit